jgi:hypothetical protein
VIPRRGAAGRLRIIVLGYVIRGPLAGMVWSNLQFLDGLARLGHDVQFLEDSDDYPSCYDPSRHVIDTDPSYGLRFAADAFERIGFGRRWTYHDAHAGRWHGPGADTIASNLREADVVLNLCGVNPLRGALQDIAVRVLVDEDPAFTQIRHLTDPAAREGALRHNAFFTFAENFAQPGCGVPDDGLPWQPTRQPLVLDSIAAVPGRRDGAFTTVMQWDSYPPREHGGVRFGMKSESLAAFEDLPARAGPVFELAIGGATTPRDRLQQHGWRLLDPLPLTRDATAYSAFIAGSKAEFGIAKHGYVVSRSGWFSERSVAYLAHGRPVVVQDTGFGRWLDADAGVLPFSTLDDAARAVADVDARYERHCAAAREVAARHFDSRRVLPSLLERAMQFGAQPASGTNRK